MKKAFVIALREEVGHVSEIHGHPVIYTGVGKVNAALAVMELLRLGIHEAVNIGSCGSTQHATGEIIRVGKVYQDIDCTPICTYGHTGFEENSHFIVVDEESDYTCFTTDYFYDQKQSSKYSPDYLQMIHACSVFDMELYGLAKACRREGIKLRSYKWVSDDGDHTKWLENCLISSQRVMEMLDV